MEGTNDIDDDIAEAEGLLDQSLKMLKDNVKRIHNKVKLTGGILEPDDQGQVTQYIKLVSELKKRNQIDKQEEMTQAERDKQLEDLLNAYCRAHKMKLVPR